MDSQHIQNAGEAVSVGAPAVKVATAWAAALGLSTWSDWAAAAAMLYTLLLIGEWFYKKFVAPKRQRRTGDKA